MRLSTSSPLRLIGNRLTDNKLCYEESVASDNAVRCRVIHFSLRAKAHAGFFRKKLKHPFSHLIYGKTKNRSVKRLL